jgi:PAS domain S-box-containing protein
VTLMLTDLDRLIDVLPIGVYVCEAPGGAIRLYNRRAVELWGREPVAADRFCGSHLLFDTAGHPLAHAASPMAVVLRGAGAVAQEVILERPDGSRITAYMTASPLHDAGGRLVGAVAALDDVSNRKATEEALRVSERRYRAMVEGQPEMVCRFLDDGTLTFVNPAYRRYFGIPADVRPSSLEPRVFPDDLARVRDAIAGLTPASPSVMVENRVFRGDGQVRWTQWFNHAVFDEHGHRLELQATGRDVTEHRQDGEAAAWLAAIVAGADDAIISKTLEGIVTSWNPGAELLFGYSAAEAVGRSITMIIPPDRLPEEQDILARLRRGEAIDHFETERMTKDGRIVPISLSVSPVRDAHGRVIGASKIARDSSEKRRARQRLEASVQTLETLYRLAAQVGRARGRGEVADAGTQAILSLTRAQRASVLAFDDAGVMRFVSWSGLSDGYRTAVDGHSPWTREARDPQPILVEDVEAAPELAALLPTIRAEGIRAMAFIPLVYQGRLLGKFMLYYDAPHRVQPDELQLVSTVAQHVSFGLARAEIEQTSERLLRREQAARLDADAARKEAVRANRGKDEFLAMLAHELRNPLAVIVNAIALIDSSPTLEGGAKRASGMVRRQADHLARLLDDLLDVARITSGRIELERSAVDLRAAVSFAVETQRPQLDAKEQKLGLAFPDGPVTVLGDAVRLQQVLANLVNNACKYTPAGGSIRISLEVDNGQAVLRVRDDGAGIPQDQLDSIFELFAQANPTLARTEGGLGIGLTLVKQIVELHGGTVSATSAGLGKGAEFTVRLSLASSTTVAAPRAGQKRRAAPLRVVVVEDQIDGREALAAYLERQGHDIRQAGTGQEGIDVALASSPDVVLVDIGLPDIDGYEVARRLRKHLGRRVQLVALTGYGQPQDRTRAEEAGFDAHLVKPVDPPLLIETLGQLTLSQQR